MKIRNLIIGILAALVCGGCADLTVDADEATQNEYMRCWINKFGIIDSEQNWNMAQKVVARVDPAALGGNTCDDIKVNIYTDKPRNGGRLIGCTSMQRVLTLDVRKDAESVYVVAADGARTISSGYYPIVSGRIDITGPAPKAPRRAPQVVTPVGGDNFDWTLACEDMGSLDDYDFNDIVIGINHVSGDGGDKVIFTGLAAGGVLAANIYINGNLVGEIHNMVSGDSNTKRMLNTSSWDGMGTPVEMDVPSGWNIATDMGGITLEIEGRPTPITAPAEGAAPQIICIQGDWCWPKERQGIEIAYPGFADWVGDASAMDWAESPAASQVIAWRVESDVIPGDDDEEEEAEPQPGYSRGMIESQGEALSSTWSSGTKQWDYVPGLVTKAIVTYCEQYPDDDTYTPKYYQWAEDYCSKGAIKDNGDVQFVQNGSIVTPANFAGLADNTIENKTVTLDNINSAKVLISLYKHDPTQTKYQVAAQNLYEYLRGYYYRIKLAEGAGGFWHKKDYPNQMWLDGLYMGSAFLAEYVAAFNPSDAAEAWDDITLQFTTIHSHTWDTGKKLNYHAWAADPTNEHCVFWAKQEAPYLGTSPEFWGRSIGWYFAALVDVLECMPTSNSNYNTLCTICQAVAEGVVARQDATAHVWYQLMQYDGTKTSTSEAKTNYLESSASSMFTYALFKGVRIGVLPASYKQNALDAYQGLFTSGLVTGSGSSLSINNVCSSAGLGNSSKKYRDGSVDYYLNDPTAWNSANGTSITDYDTKIVSNDGKAIGPFIFASLEYELATAGEVSE